MLWNTSCCVKTKQFALIIVLISLLWKNSTGKKTHCLSIPTLPVKVDYFIRSCQREIKSNIIDDLVFATLNDNHYSNVNHHDLLVNHIEYLSKNPHLQYGHHSPHYDGYDFGHETYVHEAPHFINPYHHHHHHHPHHERHPNSFDYHQYTAISPGYHLNAAFPHSVEEIISDPPRISDPPAVREKKIIEAHEELMNILSNHKVVERDARNYTATINSRTRKIMKRSLLDMLTSNKWSTTIPQAVPTASVLPLHPVLLSGKDRWLAGCLMHCIFQKTHSLDRHGYPTLDGLVDLYTSGTNDQIYFIFTLRAVNKCLKLISYKHHVHKGNYPHKAETCDIAFDVFDCISDSIAYYCNS